VADESVGVAGGCGRLDDVPRPVDEADGEAGHMPHVVAALAQTAAVGRGGPFSAGVGLDVVQVPDRRIAVRVAAVLVSIDE
jgi:hypothetical protein